MKGPGLRQPTRSRDYPEEPDFFDDPEEDDLQNSHLREGELEDRSVQDHDMGDVVMGNQMEDDDDDDGYDDELFDRLSSSPSIDDDGKYVPFVSWPSRVDSIPSESAHFDFSSLQLRDNDPQSSSSPYLATPEHYPMFHCKDDASPISHHHLGKYFEPYLERSRVWSPALRIPSEHVASGLHESVPGEDCGRDEASERNALSHLLLPLNDPLLSSGIDGENEEEKEEQDISVFNGMVVRPAGLVDHSEIDDITIYTDDDNDDFCFTTDSRFIDSGWGGECLRDIEDIDLEFVYALRTFVAEVEGQAHATKGDTMVLLDDSNSYWWLVRVVKDSSIGISLPALSRGYFG